MKSKTFFLALGIMGLLLVGCKSEDTRETMPYPYKFSEPSGAIVSTQVTRLDDVTMQVNLEIFAVNEVGAIETELKANDFSVANDAAFQYNIKNVSLQGPGNTKPYSAAILLDQSGSIVANDPSDLRIEGTKIFLGALGNGDDALLAAFSGSIPGYYETYSQGFLRDPSVYDNALALLANSEEGGTPLYYAADELVGIVAQQATNSNRAIICFTDGEDGGYLVDGLNKVISDANLAGVKLFTVGLGAATDQISLTRMAHETGGAFFWASEAGQLISMFGSLGNLLNGSAELYQVSLTVKKNQGNWSVGASSSANLEFKVSGGKVVYIPFQVTAP